MSYGCWTGTNSEKILKFFEGRITACEDLYELYTKTEEDSKRKQLKIFFVIIRNIFRSITHM